MGTTTTKFLIKNPLFLWSISFILGVASVLYFSVSIQLVLFAILLIAGFVFFLKRLNTETFVFMGVFLALGIVITSFKIDPASNFNNSGTQLVEIIESKHGKGLWDQAIVRAKSKYVFQPQKFLLIHERGSLELVEGDIVAIRTKFERIKNKGNPGEFDAETYWKSKGIQFIGFVKSDDYLLIDTDNQSFFNRINTAIHDYSNAVLDSYLPEKSKGLMKAMILGDRTDLNPEIKEAFVHAGAMHVLAVSGLHIGLIAYFLSFLLKRFIFRNRVITAVVVTIILLWIYAAITGFSPSVLRSVIMFSFLIGGQLYGRSTSSLNILLFTAMVILAYDPFLLSDLGFQLSFLAMVGIFTVYPIFEGLINTEIRPVDWAWKGSVVGVSAQVMTFPIALYHFHQFSNYFVFSNLIVMVFATVLLGLGILLLVIGKLSFIAKGVGVILGWSIFFFIEGIVLIDQLPGSVAYGFSPQFWWIILIYSVIVFLVIKIHLKRKIAVELVLFTCLMLILQVQRYQNFKLKEVVVFNYTDPVIIVKNGTEQICFYKAPLTHIAKIEGLVKDYQKIYPGDMQFVNLEHAKHVVEQSQNSLLLKDQGSSISMQINKQSYSILRDLKQFNLNKAIRYIALPRLEESNLWFHFLEEGALRIPL